MKSMLLFVILISITLVAKAGTMGLPNKWVGLYAGGNTGAAWGLLTNHLSITNNSLNPLFYPPVIPGINKAGSSSLNPLRATVGGQVGFNHELKNNLLTGLEFSYHYVNLSQTLNQTSSFSNSPVVHFYSIKNVASATQMATFRPRLGYHSDSYLIYITGGGAAANIKYNQTFTDHQFSLAYATSLNAVRYGGVLGGGLEYFPFQALSFKIDYLYANFGSTSISNQFSGTESMAGLSATVKNSLDNITIQTLLFGINWHFA